MDSINMAAIETGSTAEAAMAARLGHSVREEGEKKLTRIGRRFASDAPLADEPVTYEFTRDPALLHQYYNFRVDMYRRVLGACDFNSQEDPYDKLSHILIARRGRLCIGGCRITVREPDETWLLPMENEAFHLKRAFPDLGLDRHPHAELSRFAILEEYNQKEVLLNMSQLIAYKAYELGLHHFFARSVYNMARNWTRQAVATGNVYDAKIARNVEVPGLPAHPDIKMHLTVFSLNAEAEQNISLLSQKIKQPESIFN